MTTPDLDRLAALRDAYRECFGCGTANGAGLAVSGFEVDGSTVHAEFIPKAHHEGLHGILHGGIVATALDEILAWTSILVAGHLSVTATLDIKYRAPAPASGSYALTGRLVERRGRRLVLEGACDTDGRRVAEASGLFLATDPI